MVRRRLLTIPLLIVVWLALIATAPLTLVLAVLVGAFRRRRFVIARLNLFAIVYTTLECVGLILAFGIGRDAKKLSALQTWWASTLFGVAKSLLQLDVRIHGEDAFAQGPFILLLRHTSLADSLLPAAIVTRRSGVRLRYVLKKELLVDPCLDVVGNRLPNHFIDRSQPTPEDLTAIAKLATNLGTDEGVIIYPEGTRFTEAKRTRVLERMRAKASPYFATAMGLKHTLPPRAGGVHALLNAAPDTDVVVCAHTGFEGFATLSDLLSGAMVGRTLHVAFWRVGDAPRELEELTCWLYERWKEVDAFAASNVMPTDPTSHASRSWPFVPVVSSTDASSFRPVPADLETPAPPAT